MHFIAVTRGCSASQNWYFLGFGTVLLLLRSDFSRYPTETSQAENNHASFSNILLIERKLFGEVISCLGPLYSSQQVVNRGIHVELSYLNIATTKSLMRFKLMSYILCKSTWL